MYDSRLLNPGQANALWRPLCVNHRHSHQCHFYPGWQAGIKALSVSTLWWNTWPLLATLMPMPMVSLYQLYSRLLRRKESMLLIPAMVWHLPNLVSATKPKHETTMSGAGSPWRVGSKITQKIRCLMRAYSVTLYSMKFVLSSFFCMVGTDLYIWCTFCKCIHDWQCLLISPSPVQHTGQLSICIPIKGFQPVWTIFQVRPDCLRATQSGKARSGTSS